jgi:hypothetical protein
MNRFDRIILTSTLITSIITFLLFIVFKIYKYLTLGIWVKSVSTCQVFSILCFDNFIFSWLSNIEAFLFVPIFFASYFILHKLIINKK